MYSGPGKIIFLGKVDVEVQNLNFDLETGNREVKTQEKGYAGHARGALMVNASLDYAIPESGPFIDWIAVAKSQKEITFTIQFATKQYVVQGNVNKAGMKSSAEGECNANAAFMGKILSESTVAPPAS